MAILSIIRALFPKRIKRWCWEVNGECFEMPCYVYSTDEVITLMSKDRRK